jgi:AcrR family transcriptional regulator
VLRYTSSVMTTEHGLRERKKQQTRERIGAAAIRLFQESGFDNVTVADIARAADVSEGTVFNYFPTKESLVFTKMETFERSLLKAISDREPGESVLAAFSRFFADSSPALAARSSEAARVGARIISDSVTLRTREREIIEAHTRSLAALIAEEAKAAPGDIEPWVTANALMGVHRAMLDRTRRGVLDGLTGEDLARDVLSQAELAFARLGRGFADYAVRPRG